MEVESVPSSTSAMIPLSMWESMQSWLTPTILFLLLNLMIATIALTSSSLSSTSNPTNNNNKDKNNTSTDSTNTSSSPLIHRLRSINLSPFKSLPETHHSVVVQPSLDEPFNTIATREVTRTRSSDAAELAAPPLAARIKKSASMKSPFAHFQDADVAEVEARRPATVRERRREKKDREGDEEVDAKADDFINRFKNQLKLQRMDSIVRYKEMISRGAGEN